MSANFHLTIMGLIMGWPILVASSTVTTAADTTLAITFTAPISWEEGTASDTSTDTGITQTESVDITPEYSSTDEEPGTTAKSKQKEEKDNASEVNINLIIGIICGVVFVVLIVIRVTLEVRRNKIEKSRLEKSEQISNNEPSAGAVVYADINQSSLTSRDPDIVAKEMAESQERVVQNDVVVNYTEVEFPNFKAEPKLVNDKSQYEDVLVDSANAENDVALEISPYEELGKVASDSGNFGESAGTDIKTGGPEQIMGGIQNTDPTAEPSFLGDESKAMPVYAEVVKKSKKVHKETIVNPTENVSPDLKVEKNLANDTSMYENMLVKSPCVDVTSEMSPYEDFGSVPTGSGNTNAAVRVHCNESAEPQHNVGDMPNVDPSADADVLGDENKPMPVDAQVVIND